MPAAAHDSSAVTVAETGVGRYQVEVLAPGGAFLADEPVDAGGLGSGPNPYDLLASALGACTAMTVRMYAERKGWPLDRVTVRVLHRRDGLKARDRFAREVTLEGALDEAQRSRLMQIADRCPVHRTLEGGSDIFTVAAQPPPLDRPAPSDPQHVRDMAEACCD